MVHLLEKFKDEYGSMVNIDGFIQRVNDFRSLSEVTEEFYILQQLLGQWFESNRSDFKDEFYDGCSFTMKKDHLKKEYFNYN